MRPIRLVMQSFGSYGQRTEIDFTKPDQNLFLITGDTGSGKTTIFDAIVFALYGEASSNRNRKDGEELQSQYSDIRTEPFVELTFSEKTGAVSEEYRVRRIPRHLRALKRGKGRRMESESVSLEMPDGSVYPQKETDAKLVDIIGLTKTQFTQVAMIAQGEFMEVLRADSNKKKEIFRKLFRTEKYQNIVDELARRRKEKLADIAEVRTACRLEAGHIEVPEEYVRAGVIQAEKQQVIDGDRLNVAEAESLLEELSLLNEYMNSRKEALEKDYRDSCTSRDLTREAYAKAEGILQSFRQMEDAEKVLAGCRAHEEEIRVEGELIRSIQNAIEVRQAFRSLQEATQTAEETGKELNRLEAALPDQRTAYEKTTDLEKTADDNRRQEADRFTKTRERVSKARDLFRQITEAGEAVADREKKAAASNKAAVAAEEERKRLETQKEKWTGEKSRLADADVRWNLFRENTLTGYNRLLEEKTRVSEAAGEYSEQKKTAEKAAEEYRDAWKEYQKKNSEYNQRQTEFLNDQAGFLAARLVEGEPCPVCGSRIHPDPCRLPERHTNLTKEDIDTLAEEVGNSSRIMTEKAAASKAAADLLEEKRKQARAGLEEFRKHLIEMIPEASLSEKPSFMEMSEAMKRWRRELETKKEELERSYRRLAELNQSLEAWEEQSKALLQIKDEAVRRVSDDRAALAAAKAQYLQLVERRDFETEEQAARVLREAEEKRQKAEERYQLARAGALRARAEKEKTETLIAQLEKAFPLQKKTAEEREESYRSMLKEKKLTEKEWVTVLEEHTREEASRLQEKIDRFQREKASAQGALDTARKAVSGQTKPDLDALGRKRDQEEERYRRIQAERESVREIFRADSAAYRKLASVLRERGRIAEEFSRIDSLYNRLAGKVTGARMDIETFVQRYYLRRILHAANIRFSEMSAGQYELRMVDDSMAGEGRNRGLDLMVYSFINGQEREVRTLSGGESFMAALSLALGLADQIQESSASIHPDIMFIDEGFGSLDDHARDQAVRVLKEMDGGTKLIGIISHVTELRQEIEDQLQVVKDDNGSHARWRIS